MARAAVGPDGLVAAVEPQPYNAAKILANWRVNGFTNLKLFVAAAGEKPGDVFSVLPQLTGVRGRMQLAATRANGATVFVDYAHTDDALRNALLPVVTYLGPAAAGLVSGSFVVESLFDVPGMGRLFVTAIINRDVMLILGTTIVYAAALLFLNLAADLANAALNPKVARGR